MFISGHNTYGQGLQFKFFSEEVKVYPDPTGSWLPLVQNNLHAEVSCAGEASSELLKIHVCLCSCRNSTEDNIVMLHNDRSTF